MSEGSQAIQIEIPGDWLSQSFATVIGENYTVSLDLSAFGGGTVSPLFTSLLGVTVGSVNATFTGNNIGYATKTLQFTADSSITTLKFENLYAGDPLGNYPHIDNVSVSGPAPVPIPPILYLLGTGLIAMIGMERRKKTNQSAVLS